MLARFHFVVTVLAVNCVVGSTVQAQHLSARGADRYFSRHLVGFEDGNATTQSFAEEIALTIGSKVLAAKKNPVCCLWVERWSPSPGESGYLILLQEHGGLLLFTDDASFRDAKDWINSLPKSESGMPMMPLGIKTSFHVNSTAAMKGNK